jgi:PsbP
MRLFSTIILSFWIFVLTAQTDFLTFSENGYQISYPQTWSLDSSRMMGSQFFLFSPLESETDKFKENINLIIQDLAGQTIDLEQYATISEGQIKQFFSESNIIESKIDNSEQGQFLKLLYTIKQGNFNLKILSICFIKNGKAYLLTFTTEVDKYTKFEKLGQQIIDSFVFLK